MMDRTAELRTLQGVRPRRPSFTGDQQGAALVEFAFVSPLLFGLLLATLEVGSLEMVSAGFHNAVISASRHIRTGQASGTADAAAFKKLICSQMAQQAECRRRLTVSVQPYGDFASAGRAQAQFPGPEPLQDTFDRGGPGDIILVNATYRWPMLTPFTGDAFLPGGTGEVLITARMLFKNEPYQ